VEQAERDSGVTLAELLAAFSLATDLGLDAALGGPGDLPIPMWQWIGDDPATTFSY
jgi:hypothetical protein